MLGETSGLSSSEKSLTNQASESSAELDERKSAESLPTAPLPFPLPTSPPFSRCLFSHSWALVVSGFRKTLFSLSFCLAGISETGIAGLSCVSAAQARSQLQTVARKPIWIWMHRSACTVLEAKQSTRRADDGSSPKATRSFGVDPDQMPGQFRSRASRPFRKEPEQICSCSYLELFGGS